MSNNVEFTDNRVHVRSEINDAVIAWLYEVSGEAASQVKRNTRVDTGQLKSSWQTKVDESKLTATVGSPLENAIWEEFGTGQYALNGNGRKTPWSYQDRRGKWHHTIGKKPQRALEKAFTKIESKAKEALAQKLREMR